MTMSHQAREILLMVAREVFRDVEIKARSSLRGKSPLWFNEFNPKSSWHQFHWLQTPQWRSLLPTHLQQSLGERNIVSREVFEQALRNATIKFTYPRFVASRHPRHLEQFAKIRGLFVNGIDLDRLGWGDEIRTVLSPFINLEHLTLGYNVCQEEPAYEDIIAGLVHVWRNDHWEYKRVAGIKPVGITVAHHATFKAKERIINLRDSSVKR